MHGRNNYFFTNLKMRFLTLLTIVARRLEKRNVTISSRTFFHIDSTLAINFDSRDRFLKFAINLHF